MNLIIKSIVVLFTFNFLMAGCGSCPGDHKKITEKQMDQIQTLSREGGQGMIEVLLDKEFATETDIANIIAKSYDLPRVKITKNNIDRKATQILPKSFIISNQVLPFGIKEGNIQVAIADPTRLSVSSEIRTITDKNIDIFVTKLSELDNGLENLEKEKTNLKTNETIDNITNAASKEEEKKVIKSEEIETTSEVIKFVDEVLGKSVKDAASDIHLEHYRDGPRLRYRVDGVMIKDKTREKFLINNYPAVVTRLKIMAETNISERRLPQDGAIQFKYKGNECDFRVSFLPTKYGERVVLRLLKKEAIQLALDKLGFQKEDFLSIFLRTNSDKAVIRKKEDIPMIFIYKESKIK